MLRHVTENRYVKCPVHFFGWNIFNLLSYEQILLTNRIAGKLMNIKKIKLFYYAEAFSTCVKSYKKPTIQTTKLLSHLSAQLVNHLLRENRKSIPKFLKGKKLFKNVTHQILNYIPVS